VLTAAITGWWLDADYSSPAYTAIACVQVDAKTFAWLLPFAAFIGLHDLSRPLQALGFALARVMWTRGTDEDHRARQSR